MCGRAKSKQIELKHVVALLVVAAGVLTEPVRGLLLLDLRSRLLGCEH